MTYFIPSAYPFPMFKFTPASKSKLPSKPKPKSKAPSKPASKSPPSGTRAMVEEAAKKIRKVPPHDPPAAEKPLPAAPSGDQNLVDAPGEVADAPAPEPSSEEDPEPPAAHAPEGVELAPVPPAAPAVFSLPAVEPYDVRLLAPHLRLLNSSATVALADMLENPANEGTPFALLCAQANVDVMLVADLMEKLGVGMAKIQSSSLVSPVLQDVALDSRSTVTMCVTCVGHGSIAPARLNIPSTLESIPCPDCGGVGKIRRPGDKQARMLLFKTFGMVGGGGIQINNQVGVGVSVDGRQAKIVAAAQTLLRAGRDARLASEPDSPTANVNVIDPDELVTYTDITDAGVGVES